MTSLQETILLWRFQGQNTWKTVVGFWLKATIEFVLMIGVPLGVFIFVLTSFADLSLGTIPLVSETTYPRLISWLVLTAIAWTRLRCLYADNVDLQSLGNRSREEPANDSSRRNSSQETERLEKA